MAELIYLSHPQVKIDPDIPVPSWGLTDEGRRRAEAAARSPRLRRIGRIVSSTERKAIETAEAMASVLGLAVETREGLHENDRSSTGYVPPDQFEELADRFFSFPQESVRGWERAVDAQSRIVGQTEAIIRETPSADILIAGHGGVGTLLYCHYAALPISRAYDQQAGGGNFFAVDLSARRVLHGWRPLETMAAGA